MAPADAIWNRAVAPDKADLSPEVAEYFLSLTFADEDKARYQELAAMDQVELSPGQRSELEALVNANVLLMLLQAKARLSLKKRHPAA